ncbi:MAG: DUF4920 domain-containing protein [Xanthomonadales bacterium]|nr:DUF4920 domain-containing protein [Xanthomonadales bacterium]
MRNVIWVSGLMLAAWVSPVLAADFGAGFPDQAQPLRLSQAVQAEPTEGEVVLSGRIVEVCQKQGCWMMLEDDGVAARVMMRDHAFSVPKDASGEALVFGKLVRETLSEEQVRHMAEESHSGQAPAAQEWRVDAAAVRIPGATQEADQAASS